LTTPDSEGDARACLPAELPARWIGGPVKRRLVIIATFTLAMGLAVAGLALATAGSGVVSVEYGRHTVPRFVAEFRNHDIVVSELSFAPGGFTGWHSHPGKVIVGVARGSITLYRASDPDCAGTTYHAGDVFIERGHAVHEARNEGTVAAVVNATFLNVAPGASSRIDEAQPANCA
jgi:quercetin dioxygenase-like cupin family protein